MKLRAKDYDEVKIGTLFKVVKVEGPCNFYFEYELEEVKN